MIILETKNLYKSYQKEKIITHALVDINISIYKKDFIALVGPSGSGKTTLLHLLGGLDVPTKGDLFLEKKSLKTMNSNDLCELRKHNIGYIFQSFNLLPVLTAEENVEFPLILQKISKHIRRERVDQILKKVGLENKKQNRPAELSGGQQQRVAVARALVTNPKLILADEPTANLDSTTANQLLDIMEKMNEDLGATFLFSTHDPMIVKRAKKVIVLKDGQVESYENQK